MKKKIIAFILTVTTLVSLMTVTSSAAVKEEFLSEVALVYKNSVEEAREAISGTDWKLFEYNLNNETDLMYHDGVFLIYKTSENVEDAITDLRVMDMYGGYSTTNYQQQLEESRQEYLQMVKEVRTVASEFKALYAAGDEMAALAYRQMNYYRDTKTSGGKESNLLMGEFFLNIPSDEALVRVLMEGNSIVVSNLLTLLAIGISGTGEGTLASRVEDNYAIRDTFTDEEYFDNTSLLLEQLEKLAAKIRRYDALKEKYDMSDDEISEEEYQFMADVLSAVVMLDAIKLGDGTLTDLLRDPGFTVQSIYPITASLTEAQIILASVGMLETVIKYASPTKPIEELNAMVDEMESTQLTGEDGTINVIDVYVGVDRTIFSGSFAMTNEAMREQSMTGKTWDGSNEEGNSMALTSAYAVLGALDALCAGVALGIGIKYKMLSVAVKKASDNLLAMIGAEETRSAFVAKWGLTGKGMAVMAAAIALIMVGLKVGTEIYNYYNPIYTEIPNVIIDVNSTDTGDKYIKYTAAKVYQDEQGRNADFNAYQGKEWVALYYTKDATAGNSLTAKFTVKDNDSTVARRHQGVSMFGEYEAFNLNSHVYSKSAPAVYLTVRYSNTKKAAADIPSAIGSMIITGSYYGLSALLGVGAGVGAMAFFGSTKGKKKKDTDE